jgi:hypothetical protein
MRGIVRKWMNSLMTYVFFPNNCDQMQSKLNDLCRKSRKAALMINYAKTEEIRVNNKIDRPITTENRQINTSNRFLLFAKYSI